MLELQSLRKAFGALKVTDDVSLFIERGELRAVIGPNGAGKTSLLAQIAGELASDDGQIVFAGGNVTAFSLARPPPGWNLSYLPDHLVVSPPFGARQCTPSNACAIEPQLSLLSRRAGGRAINRRGAGAAGASGSAGEVAGSSAPSRARRAATVGNRARARRRSAAAAARLADRRDGVEDTARISRLIGSLKGTATIILVEHDMPTVFAVADRITVLVNGREIFTGLPADVRSNAQVQASYLGDDADA